MSAAFQFHRLWASLPARVAGHVLPVESMVSSEAIHLTLDDGPAGGVTARILDHLADHGATATFFLQGDRCVEQGALIRRMINEGHEVASHGMRHVDAWRVGVREAVEDLRLGTETVEQAAGCRVERVRPPYGHLRLGTLRWVRASGRSMTLWSHMAGDYRPEAIPSKVALALQRVPPGAIVVAHDSAPHAAETVAALLEAWKDRTTDSLSSVSAIS